jgi:uncharacterized protein (TIGR03382 family)
MRSAVLLGILLAAVPASAGTISSPILGGQQTTVGQFPSVVAIEVGGGLCTGTLISPDWVLTAAHCVQGVSAAGIQVHFGTVSVFSKPGVTIGASMAIAKPGFSTNNLGKNDIGLIKLAKSVNDITPVPVNLLAEKAPVGIKVTMVGYGATSVGGGGNIGTQYVVEQTSTPCNSFAGSDADLLCFNQVSGKGKCQGDSGGPSFAMIDGRMVQVGVTSFGDQNCSQFGADTRTDAERGFLLQYVPSLECDSDDDCPNAGMCFLKKCIAQPFTGNGLGTACTGNGDCDSGQCAVSGEEAFCSMGCTVGAADTCPSGFDCLGASGGTGACWPIPEDTGCCDASGRGAPTMLFGIALVGLVWRRRRR